MGRLRPGVRIAALAAMAAALAACGGSGAASVDVIDGTDAGPVDAPAQPAAMASPDPELSDALDDCEEFPVDAADRPLVILQHIVGGGEWRTDKAANAFGAGAWRAPSQLPDAPEQVDGLPVISAGEALEVLRAEGSEGRRTPSKLAITDIRLSSIPDTVTDRGPRRLPAWRVIFEGLVEPILIPAVAPPARFARGSDEGWNGDLAIGHADSAVLTLRHLGRHISGPCSVQYRVDIAESRTAVAYRVVPLPQTAAAQDTDPAPCQTMLSGRETPIELAAPLGNRVLVRVGEPFGPTAEHPPGPTPLIKRKDVTHPAMG
jgi:hypothetical protein